MALTLSSVNQAFLPTDSGALIVRPVAEASVALQVATVIRTEAASFRVPIVAADPSAAWVAEGAEIPATDAGFTEAVVNFKKLAGLSIISRELADDSSPEAANVVGQGLARDLARKLDAAFFATTTTNGPAGLGSITAGVIDKGAGWSNVDPFTAALYAAEAEGATVDTFVVNPADGLALSALKEASGSNKPLLQPDTTQTGRRVIAGVPLITSPAVPAGTAWAIPRDRVLVVIRDNVEIESDRSAFFTSDRVAVRATMRVGFAFPHPLSIVKIYDAP